MEVVSEFVREMALGVGLFQLVKVRSQQVYVYISLFSFIWVLLTLVGMMPCMDLNDVPTNGNISYNNGTVNNRSTSTVATYRCNTGYVLVGDTTRVCQVNGLWNSTPPSCERKPCLPIKCISFVQYNYYDLSHL